MHARDITEVEAISRAQQGDERAYELLYHQYRSHVFSLSSRITNNACDAEDITQEVFLQLFRKLSSFRGEAKFGTWLHRITVNCALMHLRKRELRTSSLAPPAFDVDSVPFSPADRSKPSASATLTRLALEQALQRLAVDERSVLLLHDVGGLTHNEIAQRLGLSETCSRSRLHRAHLELRETLYV